MVSLVNFKMVDAELQGASGAEMCIKVIHSEHQNPFFQSPSRAIQEAISAPSNKLPPHTTPPNQPASKRLGASMFHPSDQPPASRPSSEQAKHQNQPASFVVTWRNLKFSIEPKWHQRLGLGRPGNESNQPEMSNQQSVVTKIVLDKLDGSFKSGELTAILGPSGAGKTTLLDCLTGHRKTGLSGSIKIAAGKLSDCSGYLPGQLNLAELVANKQPKPIDGNNLKVSIIPQNDHLMGHLSVYETLCYASKMKNCFEANFNHKANIKRVAQQLGLMSCLSNRVNKLSGGQYKRVSIAQELLSSPDILILDEPTSGLDAMTCYQTIQVLRRLTDQRQAGAAGAGQKQIAVILTIHQPNSDVFQQFNHVYVVGQGGKCIYEGAPGGIESVINRIGLRLPNSYYNPATMIVEIAAGKYGQESIYKLNALQKKQYNEEGSVPDEQNSTGDSAVDCATSSSSSSSASSSSSFSNDEDEELGRARKRVRGDANNNEGLVNKAFVLEAGEQPLTQLQQPEVHAKEVVVVVPKLEEEDADSIDKLKLALADEGNRRKRRRRTRKRSGEQLASSATQSCKVPASPVTLSSRFALQTSKAISSHLFNASDDPPGPGNGGARTRAEKRVKLNSLKADQRFPFWRHTYLHFHRSWLSIIRDPMLCSMQLALHIIVPVMVSLVYGTHVGKPNACPRAGPMDIMAYALEPTDSALQLQEDLRTTLENIGYIFFKLYGIIFAAMTVTVLTFPLDMHVLVKEFRNGWYGLSSYFLGRTLADIPFQLTLPFLAMSLSYYATGQPYSYFQWRFLSITAILILSSLIAQSQGLLFGAILMDRMKAAVFVAPAATTPIILFAGFLVRTQSIPHYLRPLSNLSYLRYAIEACLISRYGFNQCECDPAVFNQTVPELPPIARSMLDYWLSSFRSSNNNQESTNNSSLLLAATSLNGTGNSTESSMLIETTTLASEQQENPDLFNKLISSLAKANSFGRNISSCEQVVPYPMIDYDLKDSQLFSCFAILITMLIFTRLLTFFIVCFKVKRKV